MSTQTYQDINRGNPIAELLDMIARRGPQMMRQGGCALPREQMQSGKRIDATQRSRIIKLRDEGKTIREISNITGWSHKTCWIYSQPPEVSFTRC